MRRRLTTAPITRTQHRRGAVLVLFAILLFVLIPLASLILQSGWLTMTRRQMQTGVNTAAVEGLRFRDAEVADADKARREKSQALLSAVYDDFDTTSDDLRFGAGPTVTFSDSEEDFIRLPGIEDSGEEILTGRAITGVGVYRPSIVANDENDIAGDIVTGNYLEGSMTHVEGDDDNPYNRTDFEYDIDADPITASSVLVRLRRSRERVEDIGTDVATIGPPVPFLFGRGPFGGPGLPLESGETDHLTRAERGTVVRATAIAQARPAWTVGMRNTALVNEGVGDFAIDETDWGSTIDVANLQRASFSGGAVSIGDSLTVVAGSPSCDGSAIYYVPITTLIGSSVRVVGFGALDLTCDGMNNILMATPQNDFVAPANASATYHGSAISSLPPAERDAVLDAMRNLSSSSSLLLAPALQRSM